MAPTEATAMDYTQLTEPQQKQMLAAIGVERVDQLYANLPQEYRLTNPLDLTGLPPGGRSELELQRQLAELAATNHPAAAPGASCFLGGGAYDHFIPTVVDHMAAQGAFVTAYTPYQAEASQGSLQAFFEFQTQICQLTALDVANASLYEGASAAAEAVLMALNVTGKRRVLVADSIHPQYRRVIATHLAQLPVEMIPLPIDPTSGRVEPATVKESLQAGNGDTACLVVQSPNVFGVIEDWTQQFEAAHAEQGTLAIALFNPTACALLKRPGQCGADIAAGEGQPLGIPLQFGGPYLGLFAAKKTLMRKMPGRLVGQTKDAQGKRTFCLTLQTREQHIRRANATSNICTNQGLLALRATIYLSAMGEAGLRDAADHCYQKAHYAATMITQIPGYKRPHAGPFFHEFVVDCPVPAQKIIDLGRARRIYPGLDCNRLGIGRDNQLLIAVTEKRTRLEIDALVALLRDAAKQYAQPPAKSPDKPPGNQKNRELHHVTTR